MRTNVPQGDKAARCAAVADIYTDPDGNHTPFLPGKMSMAITAICGTSDRVPFSAEDGLRQISHGSLSGEHTMGKLFDLCATGRQ